MRVLPTAAIVEADYDYDDLAVRLVRQFLRLCESPRTSGRMVRLVRGSTNGARAGRVLYRAINRSVLSPVARGSGVQASALKLELVTSQLIGIAMLRYVIEVEPMASASIEEVVALAAPSVRATLQA
jgi:hypothetical protein